MANVKSVVAAARAVYARLSADVRAAVGDAVTVASAVSASLGSLAAVLPALHVPAGDTAVVASVAAVLTGFVSWAARKKLTAPRVTGMTVHVQAHVITDVEKVAADVAAAVKAHLEKAPPAVAPVVPPAAGQ